MATSQSLPRPKPEADLAGSFLSRTYTTAQVADLLGLSTTQIHTYVRGGVLLTVPKSTGELRFTFEDLVLLRAAKCLLEARIPPRRVRTALGKLKDQLPTGQQITSVRITAEGNQIVVRDGTQAWNPESGQALFDFVVSDLVQETAPLAELSVDQEVDEEELLDAQEWYELGCELEAGDLQEAGQAYRRALKLDPFHLDSHLNLGRLLHEAGELSAAESHYRQALEASPQDATAAFNLGVALEDQGRPQPAIRAYERAIDAAPGYRDAYYNAACLYEKLGEKAAAVRLLKEYRQRTRGRGTTASR